MDARQSGRARTRWAGQVVRQAGRDVAGQMTRRGRRESRVESARRRRTEGLGGRYLRQPRTAAGSSRTALSRRLRDGEHVASAAPDRELQWHAGRDASRAGRGGGVGVHSWIGPARDSGSDADSPTDWELHLHPSWPYPQPLPADGRPMAP